MVAQDSAHGLNPTRPTERFLHPLVLFPASIWEGEYEEIFGKGEAFKKNRKLGKAVCLHLSHRWRVMSLSTVDCHKVY